MLQPRSADRGWAPRRGPATSCRPATAHRQGRSPLRRSPRFASQAPRRKRHRAFPDPPRRPTGTVRPRIQEPCRGPPVPRCRRPMSRRTTRRRQSSPRRAGHARSHELRRASSAPSRCAPFAGLPVPSATARSARCHAEGRQAARPNAESKGRRRRSLDDWSRCFSMQIVDDGYWPILTNQRISHSWVSRHRPTR